MSVFRVFFTSMVAKLPVAQSRRRLASEALPGLLASQWEEQQVSRGGRNLMTKSGPAGSAPRNCAGPSRVRGERPRGCGQVGIKPPPPGLSGSEARTASKLADGDQGSEKALKPPHVHRLVDRDRLRGESAPLCYFFR